jgi:hypothetical protein
MSPPGDFPCKDLFNPLLLKNIILFAVPLKNIIKGVSGETIPSVNSLF